MSRAIASVVLVVLGALLLLAGATAYYARSQIVDEQSFADRAELAIRKDEVRRVAGREIVVNLIDQGSNELIAARPLLESVVDNLLGTGVARGLVRTAARQANRALFVRGQENVAVDVADVAQLVSFGMRSVSPKLAREVPPDLDVSLLTLRKRDFATQSLEFADNVRAFGLILPPLALLCFIGAVAAAPDRRVGVLRSGVAIGAAGALLAIVVLLMRARLLANVFGEDELSDADVRGAIGGLFDAYVGDLAVWGLALAFFGLVIAGAAAALDPEHLDEPAARVRRLFERPQHTAWRAARGAGALALGIFVVWNPTLSVQIGAILGGAYLVFFGTSELLVLLQRRGVGAVESRRGRRQALASAGVAGAVAVAGAAVVLLLATDGDVESPARASASPPGGCNGSKALCDLRLNEAVFAGTHNSFSAADSPGWYIPNQRRTIPRQLRDGVRLFLIDTHWGVESGGHVRTDFKAEGRSRNRVAAALPPGELAAAERIAGRVGVRGEGEGKRGVWFCHTVCELGATDAKRSLEGVREFLDDNPGEVVILFVEPYVKPAEFERIMREAGLERYAATLGRNQPLPTLGELVRTDKRVVVFTEKDADGSVPWYLDGFSFVQDTPLGATKRNQLSCQIARGDGSSPLLMLNHWADVFPPDRKANGPFLKKQFILARAHRCAKQRLQPVNLIATDHYDAGDLVGAVKQLNAEAVRAKELERRALGG